MITNKVIQHNSYFYCWFNNDCLRYKSKGSCITAVSNKEHLSYVESKKLVNDLLSKEDCKSLKDRMDHLMVQDELEKRSNFIKLLGERGPVEEVKDFEIQILRRAQ